jgi:hypothetical protein
MSVSMQTLHDALIAIVTTVGIAVAVSIALVAAGAVFERDRARQARGRGHGTVPAQYPTQTDDARDLVLR